MMAKQGRSRFWGYLFFLMGLAAASRILIDPHSPGLIADTAKSLGNLFKATING